MFKWVDKSSDELYFQEFLSMKIKMMYYVMVSLYQLKIVRYIILLLKIIIIS